MYVYICIYVNIYVYIYIDSRLADCTVSFQEFCCWFINCIFSFREFCCRFVTCSWTGATCSSQQNQFFCHVWVTEQARTAIYCIVVSFARKKHPCALSIGLPLRHAPPTCLSCAPCVYASIYFYLCLSPFTSYMVARGQIPSCIHLLFFPQTWFCVKNKMQGKWDYEVSTGREEISSISSFFPYSDHSGF